MRARGFTLIELLMSMAIFALITGSVVANFNAGRKGDDLRIANQVLASTVRRAQALAIGGQTASWCVGGVNDKKLCPNGAAECPSGICTTDIPRGFGVRFTTASTGNTRAVLFADVDGDHAFDVGELIRNDSISSGPFVTVTALSPSAAGVLDVVFAPPKPTVWLNNANTGGTASITLTHSTSGLTKAIIINALTGQVSSQ